MKIYNITLLQLITMWFFGWSFWAFYLIDSSDDGIVVFVGIPFLLVFYTFGWIKYKKDKK